MTALWDSSAAAIATGGKASAGWAASGVSIDSRSVQAGDLFVAIRGPNTDGHRFVRDALENGAAAAMVARDWVEAGNGEGLPLLVVEDTDAGLATLGGAARSRSAARIAAVTGSVGKTSTKDALAHVLARQGATSATRGNLNNQWGLPLSLARMPEETVYGVFELGMNHAGELTPLSRLLRPNVAVITTVESVHLEFFGSEEAIADAKAEIFAGMDENSAAVLNLDNRHFDRLKEHARRAGVGRVFAFGTGKEADFRLVDWHIANGGNRLEVDLAGRPLSLRSGAPGRHWAMIALSVLGTAWLLGADVEAAAAAIADVEPPKGRGLQRPVDLPTGGRITVIDESYNASPASMRAAIAVLGATPTGPEGRRIAVLGDMLELGPDGPDLHAGLAADLESAGIDLVFCAGPNMAMLDAALPAAMRGGHAAASDGLIAPLVATLRAGDAITVKGSLGSRMAPLVEALLALGDNGDDGAAVRPVAGEKA